MTFSRPIAFSLIGAALLAPTPALAGDEDFEFWLNPSVGTSLDDDTSIELETSQRFRSSDNGRVDTYFFRGWVKQRVAKGVTLAGAVEQRLNDGGSDELRTMQQLSTSHGVFKTRLRVEQRFVENRGGRMGLRLRPRIGVEFPLDDAGKWSVGTNAELFWTLRGTSPDGDTGITGLRNQISVSYKASENIELGLTYLRQQDFEPGAPDEIGHAPLIGIEFTF